MKERMLGVPPQLLQEKTAVCGPVAEAMAIGVLLKSAATVAVSITGIAGPDEDEDEDEDGNPVGLVYCAVARNNNTHRHIRLKCRGTPDAIIEEACIEALRLLRSFCFS
jgi:PncC family amidohydrolase